MAVSALLLTGAVPPPPGPSVDVSITGLRSSKGQVLVCLTTNAKAFPDCSKDKGAVKMAVKATGAAHFSVAAPADGTYAIALVHDENGNHKMDMALFMPKEGFGFSRNPAIGMGPPKFASASFVVSGETAQSIKMKYML